MNDIVRQVSERYQLFGEAFQKGYVTNGSSALLLPERYAWPVSKESLGLSSLDSINKYGSGAIDDDEKAITVVISTTDPDRDGDVVQSMGVDITDFSKSPSWFFGHQSWEIPIGTSRGPDGGIAIWPEENRVVGKCWFDQNDSDAMLVYQKCRDGFINSTSIAFIPLVAHRRDEIEKAKPYRDDNSGGVQKGWYFSHVSLTEVSWVGVGANQNAVIMRDLFDQEQKYMSPRLRKAWLPYCAKSKKEQGGGCFSGWCACPPCDVKKEAKATNHLGEREFQTYAAWLRAIKAEYPNITIDGDKDIATALSNGRGVGEWDGERGSITAKPDVPTKGSCGCDDCKNHKPCPCSKSSVQADVESGDIPPGDIVEEAGKMEKGYVLWNKKTNQQISSPYTLASRAYEERNDYEDKNDIIVLSGDTGKTVNRNGELVGEVIVSPLNLKKSTNKYFSPGDKVRITGGEASGARGKVVSVENGKVTISLDLGGEETVPTSQVSFKEKGFARNDKVIFEDENGEHEGWVVSVGPGDQVLVDFDASGDKPVKETFRASELSKKSLTLESKISDKLKSLISSGSRYTPQLVANAYSQCREKGAKAVGIEKLSKTDNAILIRKGNGTMVCMVVSGQTVKTINKSNTKDSMKAAKAFGFTSNMKSLVKKENREEWLIFDKYKDGETAFKGPGWYMVDEQGIVDGPLSKSKKSLVVKGEQLIRADQLRDGDKIVSSGRMATGSFVTNCERVQQGVKVDLDDGDSVVMVGNEAVRVWRKGLTRRKDGTMMIFEDLNNGDKFNLLYGKTDILWQVMDWPNCVSIAGSSSGDKRSFSPDDRVTRKSIRRKDDDPRRIPSARPKLGMWSVEVFDAAGYYRDTVEVEADSGRGASEAAGRQLGISPGRGTVATRLKSNRRKAVPV